MSAPYRIQVPLVEDRTWPFYGLTNVSQDKINKCKRWCIANVGANNWNYYGYEKKRPVEFRFKKEEDLLAFRLVFGL
jgi:hypothetical protein